MREISRRTCLKGLAAASAAALVPTLPSSPSVGVHEAIALAPVDGKFRHWSTAGSGGGGASYRSGILTRAQFRKLLQTSLNEAFEAEYKGMETGFEELFPPGADMSEPYCTITEVGCDGS